jgi:hypothetical protein
MVNFKVINPVIAGTVATDFNADSPSEAAKQFWDNVTVTNKVVVNNLPKFLFTLKDSSTDKLYHFIVREKVDENKNAEYSIEETEDDMTSEQKEDFLNEVKRVQNRFGNENKSKSQDGGAKRKKIKKGGKRDKDSSSSSSSSSDDLDDYFTYVKRNIYRPISYWWYSPSIYKIKSVFTPVFIPSVTPYVQLWVPTR